MPAHRSTSEAMRSTSAHDDEDDSMTDRHASAHWEGDGKTGKGKITTQSGVLSDNPYGFNNGFNNGWGGGYNVYQGSGWLGGGESSGGTPVVVAPRTPIWASSSINSATGGGRLLTNKMEAGGSSNVTGATQPRVFWRTVSDAAETLEGSWDENRPEQSTPEATRSTSRSSSGAGQSGWSSSPSRNSSSWSSGSRPSNSGSNRSSTRPSAPSRPSSGGRSTGGSSRSGGRGGSPRR